MAKIQLEAKTVNDYGCNLYYVRATQKICKNYDITVRADGYNIEPDGTLTFYRQVDDNTIENTISIRSEFYQFVFLAAEQGQYPLAVERWSDVANVRVIVKEKVEEKEIEKEKLNEKMLVDAPTEENQETTKNDSPETASA